MTFINPSLEKVFQTLISNDDLINHLKSNSLLITKSSLYDNYTPEKVKEMEMSIYVNNVNTLYDIAQVLINFSDEIKENQIWYLLSHKIAWKELCEALVIPPETLKSETYKLIIYTYKYCVVSSFFQNNREKFIPETDIIEMEKNPAAKAFIDAMMKEFDKLDVTISDCLNFGDYETIPYDKINYLTQLLGWEKKDINADEDTEKQFRELAKNILDVYRIKGTNYSFELFFNFLGFNIEIKEYYFDRRLFYTTNSAGNQETESSNNSEYEYYLTINNPADNKLENLGIGEIVSSADITPQYSLHEFDKLCKEYGPEAVLGYSPVYPVYNSNGELVEYKEYTGKIYKYFKTNVIYYTVSMDGANPTEKQLVAVTKYLEFLTPSYVMHTIKVDTFSENSEEPLGFDGDGSGSPDAYGNYNSFQMLDSEDWSQDFKDEYTLSTAGSLLKRTKENEYNGKEQVYENYVNSVGENKYRLPLGRKTIAASTSKFLTGGTGTNYPQARRLKYYILYTLDGKPTSNWGEPNVVIAPYYTIPPFIGSENYISMKNSWEKKTSLVNLTGGDGQGGEKCVKTQIRDAQIETPIDYCIDCSIDEFLNDETFNELEYHETFAKKLIKIKTINYGETGKYSNAYEAFIYEIAQRNIKVSNISSGYNNFIDEVLNNNKNTEEKEKFNSEIYNDELVKNYYKNDILKNLNFGDYALSFSGTLESGKLVLYRYGYAPFPIEKNPEQYKNTYLNYLNSFNYILKKDYNGSLSNFESVNLATNYISKQTLFDAEEYIQELRKDMIELATEKDMEEWLPLDYITSKLFYITADGEYYRAVKIPAFTGISNNIYPSGKNHVFNSISEAETYFENHPEEKVNNAEFYINSNDTEKGLYCFNYKNRKKDTLVYSLLDEKLYKVDGASRQDIKEVLNWYGDLILEENNSKGIINSYTAKINRYDCYWKGYDEEADEEDFIFYNSKHEITWNELGINKLVISRPIKYETDNHFDEDTSKFDKEYSDEEDISKFKIQSGVPTYYNTFGQRIIDEISSKTVDNFTSKEHIDWYIKDGKEHPNGLLSIIESNMKELVGDSQTNDFRYYSKASDFFQDYYRIVVLGNYSANSIPKEILEALTKKRATISNAQKNRIKQYYNRAIKQCADVLDSISKNRIYYSFVGNWKKTIDNSLYSWEVVPLKDDGTINAELIYQHPLNNSYGPKENKNINGKYYFDEKTSFISKVISIINDLKNKYGDNIRFDIDRELFGKDPYSLTVGTDNRFEDYNKDGDYRYSYKVYQGIKTLDFDNTHFYLSYDSLYNFYLPYSLNYGLKKYSKDFYGEQRDIYSEFTELFDLLNDFADDDSEENFTKINNFLKVYFYKKLVDLYRESPIMDILPISVENSGKKPMKAYPKLAEKFDGKAGTFASPGTLLSTFTNNGKTFGNTKLNFYKSDVILSDDYKSTTFKFYVKKQDFVNCFGFDFNRYYKNIDISKLTNQTAASELAKEIEEQYKKIFTCIRPHFFLKEHKGVKLSNWQKCRINYEVDFREATAMVVDNNYNSIVNSEGYVIDENGVRLGTNKAIKERLNEGTNIIITVVDNTITPLLKLNQEAAFFNDVSEDEQSNIYGYLTVKKLTQTFKDNYVSKPYNLDWVEKNSENEPEEYTSFGDDRFFNIDVKNKVVNINNYENYSKAEIKEVEYDDEVLQFNEFGKVLTNDGYVEFDKSKTLEDQGLSPIYKTTSGSKLENADGDKKHYISLIDEQGNEVKIKADDIEFFFDLETNEPILSVSPEILKLGNISKIKVLYNLLYINIKKIYDVINVRVVKLRARVNTLVNIVLSSKTILSKIIKVSSYLTRTHIISNGLIKIKKFLTGAIANFRTVISAKESVNFRDNTNLIKRFLKSFGKIKASLKESKKLGINLKGISRLNFILRSGSWDKPVNIIVAKLFKKVFILYRLFFSEATTFIKRIFAGVNTTVNSALSLTTFIKKVDASQLKILLTINFKNLAPEVIFDPYIIMQKLFFGELSSYPVSLMATGAMFKDEQIVNVLPKMKFGILKRYYLSSKYDYYYAKEITTTVTDEETGELIQRTEVVTDYPGGFEELERISNGYDFVDKEKASPFIEAFRGIKNKVGRISAGDACRFSKRFIKSSGLISGTSKESEKIHKPIVDFFAKIGYEKIVENRQNSWSIISNGIIEAISNCSETISSLLVSKKEIIANIDSGKKTASQKIVSNTNVVCGEITFRE